MSSDSIKNRIAQFNAASLIVYNDHSQVQGVKQVMPVLRPAEPQSRCEAKSNRSEKRVMSQFMQEPQEEKTLSNQATSFFVQAPAVQRPTLINQSSASSSAFFKSEPVVNSQVQHATGGMTSSINQPPASSTGYVRSEPVYTSQVQSTNGMYGGMTTSMALQTTERDRIQKQQEAEASQRAAAAQRQAREQEAEAEASQRAAAAQRYARSIQNQEQSERDRPQSQEAVEAERFSDRSSGSDSASDCSSDSENDSGSDDDSESGSDCDNISNQMQNMHVNSKITLAVGKESTQIARAKWDGFCRQHEYVYSTHTGYCWHLFEDCWQINKKSVIEKLTITTRQAANENRKFCKNCFDRSNI